MATIIYFAATSMVMDKIIKKFRKSMGKNRKDNSNEGMVEK